MKQIRFKNALQKTPLSLFDFDGWCGGAYVVRTSAPAAGLQTKGKGPPAKKKCTKWRLVVALRAQASAAQRSEESRPSEKKQAGVTRGAMLLYCVHWHAVQEVKAGASFRKAREEGL